MNNYVSYDVDDEWVSNVECDKEHYTYHELFEFLSNEEFEIIYQLKVLKCKRKEVAKKYKISLAMLRKLEFKIMYKIKQCFS